MSVLLASSPKLTEGIIDIAKQAGFKQVDVVGDQTDGTEASEGSKKMGRSGQLMNVEGNVKKSRSIFYLNS